jgi:hypothetical protein
MKYEFLSMSDEVEKTRASGGSGPAEPETREAGPSVQRAANDAVAGAVRDGHAPSKKR